MYFESFPQIEYLLSPATRGKKDQSVLLTDITFNVRLKKEIIDNITLYDFYIIKENETYEIISEKLYGTPYYHWILMLLNDFYDWRGSVLLDNLFDDYIAEKYGSVETAKSTIKHYVSTDGYIVDSTYINVDGVLDATPVYIYDYELDENNKKRTIKVVSTQMIDLIVRNFEAMTSE